MVDTLIRLFPANAETFTTLGLGAISDAISCNVQEVVNGYDELTMVYPADGIRIDDIVEQNIIVCKPQPHKNPQPFQIYRIVKGMGGTIEVYAEHISNRLRKIAVSPYSAASLALALQGLTDNAEEDCPFTFWTDKTVASPYKQTVPASIRQRLGGEEGSILDVYGGEYEWDNFTVKLWNHRGTNRGVTIRYGKNLIDLTQERNIADTYTGIYPFWAGTVDGQDVVVTLPEKILHSDNASSYPYSMTVPLDLSMEFEEQPTATQLRNRAQTYITANNIGVPKVSLKVSFIDLQKTVDYADIAPLEQVDLGDIVTVQFEKLGVEATAEIVSTDYNVLTDSYNAVEIGEVRASLSSTIAQQSAEIKRSETASRTFFEQAIDAATKLITGGLGGNIVFHYNDVTGYPDEIIIMDTDSTTTAVNCIRINKNGIGFSQRGYNGPFNSAWTITNTFDAEQVNVINLNATNITAGMLKSANYDSSGGTAGFLFDLVTGAIYAPSLTITAIAEANSYTDTQVAGAISTAAADATSKANAAQAAAKTYTDTQISVIPGQIQSAVTETKAYADGKAATAESNAKSYADTKDAATRTYVSQNYSTITQTANQISTAVSSIQVGGTNLLRYTANMPLSNPFRWRASGGTVSISPETSFPVQYINRALRVTNTGSSAARIGFAQDTLPGFVSGELYTQGCWIRASVAGLSITLQPLWDAIGQGTAVAGGTVGTTTTSWQYVKFEGGRNVAEQQEYYSAGYVYVANVPANGWFEVCANKVEQGNKATAWSPNPEDIEDDYDSKFNTVEQNISTLTQTASGISTEVSKKVDTTTYNANNQAISQQISSLSSRIDQTAGSIKGIVTQEISGLNAQSQSISNWFDFSVSNFLTIGQQGSAYKTQITNSAFNILHGNTTIGSFSATGLSTPSLTLETTFNLPPFVLQSISGGWILTEAS